MRNHSPIEDCPGFYRRTVRVRLLADAAGRVPRPLSPRRAQDPAMSARAVPCAGRSCSKARAERACTTWRSGGMDVPAVGRECAYSARPLGPRQGVAPWASTGAPCGGAA